MLRFIIIALGGAIGTLARYIMGGLDYRFSSGVLPISTLAVNATGSLAIGFLWGITDRFAISPNIRLFIFIGVLGGYTTFSTFSLETFNLMRDGEYRIAIINVVLSVVLSIGAVFAGYIASKTLITLFK
ncbi:MAG: fluoride efflux transporter CrcB [Candidatus Omnitrophica bacterium]|nr:fluoride efflux transporter CrcB [Candidatus Omnitrophota bacterium]